DTVSHGKRKWVPLGEIPDLNSPNGKGPVPREGGRVQVAGAELRTRTRKNHPGARSGGTLGMQLVECHHEWACPSPRGPVVTVSFRGKYPPGSLGNEHARQMRDYLATVLAETDPAAALLDLTDLEYEWGDGLATLALPLRTGAAGCRPFCIVAAGRTAAAVRP